MHMLAEVQPDSRRRELLVAMGIDVYVLRGSESALSRASKTSVASEWLVVAAGEAAMKSTQCAQLRKALPAAVGISADRIRWLTADESASFDSVPAARAYLVLGSALARSLGAHLSAKQQNASVIAVADEPAHSYSSAMSKRALWQTLKPIARRIRVAQATHGGA